MALTTVTSERSSSSVLADRPDVAVRLRTRRWVAAAGAAGWMLMIRHIVTHFMH